jgi:serine/threonine protein kinase
MPLDNGTRFGPYEVLSPLGEGGMGEVYRGRDSKLGREVALKVLPPALATDAEYIARFQREAHVLASLNHPNIAAIYGIEGPAIVMELVEGPTLADRIAQGPISIDEALPIARQIADALEYAHEKNVVHRDLKPGNVKVTPDGVVKVLDFGLAKIAESTVPQSNPVVSPTLTVRAATQAGLILGTAAYMAPEQARGQTVDRRADIWSFGALVFEMLSGKMPFQGDNVTDILASVVKVEPDWTDLPQSTPQAIRRLIARCLVKDRKRRLQAIGEARIAIEDYSADPSPTAIVPSPPPTPRSWFWVGLSIISLIALAALSFVHFSETAKPERVLRYSIPPPEKSQIHTFALSPDGRYLAVAAAVDGKRRLWVRSLNLLTYRELRGSEDARFPFWSPDSRSVGFFANGKLKRIEIESSVPQVICDAVDGRGGSWNRDGIIVFAPSSSGGLQRVSAAGGEPVSTTTVVGREIHRFPLFLPDGKQFLYVSSLGGQSSSGVMLGSIDGAPARRLLAEKSSVSWQPPLTARGPAYALFHRDGVLMAQPFDSSSLKPLGDLFPVLEQVGLVNRDYVTATISANGMLAHRSGDLSYNEQQLSWFSREGKLLSNVGQPGRSIGFALSPDGKTVAVPRGTPTDSDIWLHDLARGVETRITFDAAGARTPVWSPDSRRMVYAAARSGNSNLFLRNSDGAERDVELLEPGPLRFASDWSKNSGTVLYVELGLKGNDLWTLNIDGDRKAARFTDTPFNELQGQFSPDGKWVAFTSDESGRYEIYIRPFPSGPGKWRISLNGGVLPRWSRDGKELFFVSTEGRLFSSGIATTLGSSASVTPQIPQVLFDANIRVGAGFNNFPFAVSADGKRFLVRHAPIDLAEPPLIVVLNWLAALGK